MYLCIMDVGATLVVVALGAVMTAVTLAKIPNHVRKLWAVFVIYVWVVSTFGVVYWMFYLESPANFYFGGDIASDRKKEVDAVLVAQRQEIAKRISALRELEMLLARRRQPLDIRQKTYVSLTSENYEFEFDMRYFWTTNESGVMFAKDVLYVTARTADHQPAWVEPVTVIGPRFSDPHREQKIGAIITSALPSLYRSYVSRRILEVKSRDLALLSQLAQPLRQRRDQWSSLDFIYFSAITQLTVGYGDIMPNSTAVRIVVILQALCGVAILTFVLSHLDRNGRNCHCAAG